ncbi:MAG TPA: CstA-like transporter-associated (seleno)protein, partial [Polyangia bacterium]|nr:CstA-like transporter-associated (seleno)protein [Polyangia bacterium]
MTGTRWRLRAIWRRAVETARLCCGVPDYGTYVDHLRAHHPDRPVPT